MSYFDNKNVIVTGGASGIGYEICRQLVAQGANVLLTDIKKEEAEMAAEKISCHWNALDVRDPLSFKSCVQQFENEFGAIDILFNNAGLEVTGEAHHFEYDDWKKIIDVNVFGVINGVHAVYGDMVKRGMGQIVNTASIAGLFPSAGQVSYTASKYAVVGLSHSLRAEASGHGVKINVVCPGIIKTPMRDQLNIKGFDREKMLSIIPKGMNVKKCVSQILVGVRKNEATIVITPMAKTLWSLNRINPNLSMLLGRQIVRMMKQYQ